MKVKIDTLLELFTYERRVIRFSSEFEVQRDRAFLSIYATTRTILPKPTKHDCRLLFK